MSADWKDKRKSVIAKSSLSVVILVVLHWEKLTTLALDTIFTVTLEDIV